MHHDLKRLDSALRKILKGLDAQQTQAKPARHPEKWSIQQIVEHLLMTYRGSTPAIEARIDKGSGTRARPSPRQRVGQFRLLVLGWFPRGRRAPAAVAPGMPETMRGGDDLAARVTAELERLDHVTARGERLFGQRQAVSHVILGPLSMGQWRRFHLVHGLHHVKQMKRIRRQPGF